MSEIAIFVSPTGNNEIVGSIGLTDNEIDLSGLQALEGLKAVNIKLSCTAVGAERSVTRSFGPDWGGIPLRSFSFLRSLFSLQGNWE